MGPQCTHSGLRAEGRHAHHRCRPPRRTTPQTLASARAAPCSPRSSRAGTGERRRAAGGPWWAAPPCTLRADPPCCPTSALVSCNIAVRPCRQHDHARRDPVHFAPQSAHWPIATLHSVLPGITLMPREQLSVLSLHPLGLTQQADACLPACCISPMQWTDRTESLFSCSA